MSALAFSIAVGTTLGASMGAVTGSTVKHLERVRKATGATERASAKVKGYPWTASGVTHTLAATSYTTTLTATAPTPQDSGADFATVFFVRSGRRFFVRL